MLFAGAARVWSPTCWSTGSATLFENPATSEPIAGRATNAEARGANRSGATKLAMATGKAGFFLFLYLEVLDASFSFDGVIGAFAITSDPIIIALGLGLIGAMFVRSLTVYLVRKGTLADYVYLEHGAHWAIGALAVILLVSIGYHISEFITGLLGVAFIGAAFLTSIRRNRAPGRQGRAGRHRARLSAMPVPTSAHVTKGPANTDGHRLHQTTADPAPPLPADRRPRHAGRTGRRPDRGR